MFMASPSWRLRWDEAAVPQPSSLDYTYADGRRPGKSDKLQICGDETHKAALNRVADDLGLS
jgi:hypothetical protein